MEWQLKTMADIAESVNGIVDGPFGSNLKKSDYIDDSENDELKYFFNHLR